MVRTLLGLSSSDQPMETNALIRELAVRLVTSGLSFSSGGAIRLNDTSDANVTRGLTLNQADNDDSIITLKSSDVDHGMTSVGETDTYAMVLKSSAGSGGLLIRALSEAQFSLQLVGVVSSADATKSAAGVGAVILQGSVKSGTSAASFGAVDANLVAVRDGGTAKFILDSDGDSHQDVGTAWTNFDDGDDLARLQAVAVSLAREGDPLREQFVQHFEQHRAVIDAMPGKRLITYNDDGHHFVNMSRLVMLQTGAIRQLAARVQQMEQTWPQRAIGWVRSLLQ